MQRSNQGKPLSKMLSFLALVWGYVFLLAPSVAHAAPAQAQQGNPLITYLPFIAIFVFMYFFMMRPQRQQQKQRKAMLDSLKVGDKIITSGGVYGTITKVNEQSLRVKIAKNVEVRITRAGVSGKTTKEDSDGGEE